MQLPKISPRPPNKKGFTLIELLVVIVIISILATLGFASFQRAQRNARDARRINDLDQVNVALEIYFETNLSYPVSTSGEINCGGAIAWGAPFLCNGQTFMRALPKDPTGSPKYCYVTPGMAPFLTFSVYAQMENDNNSNITPPTNPSGCPGSIVYDYSVVSEE